MALQSLPRGVCCTQLRARAKDELQFSAEFCIQVESTFDIFPQVHHQILGVDSPFSSIIVLL